MQVKIDSNVCTNPPSWAQPGKDFLQKYDENGNPFSIKVVSQALADWFNTASRMHQVSTSKACLDYTVEDLF